MRIEAELLMELFEGGRRPERLHADDAARVADVALPSQRRGLLDSDAGFDPRRQNALPVFARLVLEDVPRWHRDHARANPLRDEPLMDLNDETDFTPRGDKDHLGISVWSVGEHVGAARHARGRRILAAIERRQRLAREREQGWLMAELQDVPVRLDNF